MSAPPASDEKDQETRRRQEAAEGQDRPLSRPVVSTPANPSTSLDHDDNEKEREVAAMIAMLAEDDDDRLMVDQRTARRSPPSTPLQKAGAKESDDVLEEKKSSSIEDVNSSVVPVPEPLQKHGVVSVGQQQQQQSQLQSQQPLVSRILSSHPLSLPEPLPPVQRGSNTTSTTVTRSQPGAYAAGLGGVMERRDNVPLSAVGSGGGDASSPALMIVEGEDDEGQQQQQSQEPIEVSTQQSAHPLEEEEPLVNAYLVEDPAPLVVTATAATTEGAVVHPRIVHPIDVRSRVEHPVLHMLEYEPDSEELQRASEERAKTLLAASAKLNFSNINLVGRETELQILQDLVVHQTTTSTSAAGDSPTRIAWLSGKTGVGKSALVSALQPTIRQLGGFFLTGKFDMQQQQMDQPYGAITKVCRNLCDSLLLHRDDPDGRDGVNLKWKFSFNQLQSTLTDSLGGGEELGTLTTAFPDLLEVFPSTAETTENTPNNPIFGSDEAQARLHHVFCKFLSCLSKFGRVILVLDDLQWSDVASIELLRKLLLEISHNSTDFDVIVIGIYRSDEVATQEHPLNNLITELDTAASSDGNIAPPVRVPLDDLSKESVNDLLVGLLLPENSQKTLPLAECIHAKTHGNVFYVMQLIKSLVSQEKESCLLNFNPDSLCWEWDIEKVKTQCSTTNNVLQIIQQKMETLPEEIRALLPLAACLGASIQSEVLCRVLGHFQSRILSNDQGPSSAEPNDFISVCEKDGLLLHDRRTGVISWVHDSIQQAALSLENESEIRSLRRELGAFLLDSFEKAELDGNIFIVANLLTIDIHNHEEKTAGERLMLADLNYKAGVKAMETGAFASASVYLDRSTEFLPDNHWNTQYILTSDIFALAAEAHFCVGNVEKVEQYSRELVSQPDAKLLDIVRVEYTHARSMATQGKTGEAEKKIRDALKRLGCNFPKHLGILHILGGIIKVKVSGFGQLEKRLPCLPVVTDDAVHWTMRLLDQLFVFSYHNGKNDLLAQAVFKSLDCTEMHGVSEFSAAAIGTVGSIFVSMGDFCTGYSFAKMAISLSETHPVGPKPRTFLIAASNCLHWREPVWKTSRLLVEGYNAGFASGDMEDALWCKFILLDESIWNGNHIASLDKELRLFSDKVRGLNHEWVLLNVQILWQFIENMLGRSKDATELDGDIMTVVEIRSRLSKGGTGNELFHFGLLRRQVETAFWGGDYNKVVSLIEENDMFSHKDFERLIAGAYYQVPWFFIVAMASFSVYKGTRKRKTQKLAMFFSRKVQKWAKKGNPNAAQFAKILKAEKKDFQVAADLYKAVIMQSSCQQLVHEQAMAHERLGELYLSRVVDGSKVWETDGYYHLQLSVNLYEQVGFMARCSFLLKKHPKLDAPESKWTLIN